MASLLTGILLINLGTPRNYSVIAVREYLNEFLSDPFVVDLPAVLRWILVKGIIAPFRARYSSGLYKKIWTEEGSPLLVNSQNFLQHLQQKLQGQYFVTLGMRYGEPDIAQAIDELLAHHCERIIILPLFPQYSLAASETAIQRALHVLHEKAPKISYQVVQDFYEHPAFVVPLAQKISSINKRFQADCILMSYHSLPVRQLTKTEQTTPQACLTGKPCPVITRENRSCYRAQCYTTSRALANELKLTEDQYQVCFQSRLGRVPWIEPYADKIIEELFQRGIRRLLVVCPSFVADCLETLEEMNIRLRNIWFKLGGEAFELVPCLNADEAWIEEFPKIWESSR